MFQVSSPGVFVCLTVNLTWSVSLAVEVTCALAGTWHFSRSTKWSRGCSATIALSWLILGGRSRPTRPSLSSKRAWRCILRKHRLGCSCGVVINQPVLFFARKRHDQGKERKVGVRQSYLNVEQESSRPGLIWRKNYVRRHLGKEASSVFQFPSYYYYYNGSFPPIFRYHSISHPLYRPTQT